MVIILLCGYFFSDFFAQTDAWIDMDERSLAGRIAVFVNPFFQLGSALSPGTLNIMVVRIFLPVPSDLRGIAN